MEVSGPCICEGFGQTGRQNSELYSKSLRRNKLEAETSLAKSAV